MQSVLSIDRPHPRPDTDNGAVAAAIQSWLDQHGVKP
jgi:hypothetical protein